MAINRTLIEGQRLMREAGRSRVGEAFAKNLKNQLVAGLEEKNAIKQRTDKFMEDLGGIQNVNLIEPSQRGVVTDFLRTKRDEFNDLATQYAENPSSELRDKMDAIKFQFQNVNNQLKLYMDKRKEYLTDRDEGDLLTGIGNEENNLFYESVYGNPDAAFSIDYKTGKISFTGVGGETKSLENFGDHSTRNYEAESTASTVFSSAKQLKYSGKLYDKNNFTQQFIFKHRGQSADEIQSLIKTDLSGDNYDYGFMQQWANGNLKDKSFYEGFEKNKEGKYDASWMLENSNKQQVLDAFGKFIGNVGQDIYDAGASKPRNNKSGSGGDVDMGRSLNDGIYANDKRVREIMRDIENNEKIVFGGKTYYSENGGYKGKDDKEKEKFMTKRDLATVIGLDIASFSNKFNDSKFDFAAGIPGSGVLKKEFQTK